MGAGAHVVTDRVTEAAFYKQVYRKCVYVMRPDRLAATVADLAALPVRGSYLDVGCGHGDMLREATALDFGPVQGTEVVPKILRENVVFAYASALPFPDASFDVATMFDVIEHLVPGDDERACRELARVGRKHVLVTASNKKSIWNGRDVHINKRPYGEWDSLFRQWFAGCGVRWLQDKPLGASERWRIDLET